MNEKPDMMINIYGGNNLIAPVASSAIQNFYGDRGDEAADQPEDSEKTESTESVTDEKPAQEPAELSDDEFYVSVYIRYKGDEGLQDTFGRVYHGTRTGGGGRKDAGR